MNPGCQLPSVCLDDVCLEVLRAGGACQDNAQCFSYECVDGVCSNDPCAGFEPSTGE